MREVVVEEEGQVTKLVDCITFSLFGVFLFFPFVYLVNSPFILCISMQPSKCSIHICHAKSSIRLTHISISIHAHTLMLHTIFIWVNQFNQACLTSFS